MRTIESLALPATLHPPRGAMAHAEAVLKAWAATDEFEYTLSLENTSIPKGLRPPAQGREERATLGHRVI